MLKEYLEGHEKETVDIMMELYNQERITEQLLTSERTEGRAEGRTEEARNIALRLYDGGMAVNEVAGFVDRSISTVQEWLGLTMA